MDKDIKYQLALLMVPKVGTKMAKNLIAYCGSAEEAFKQKPAHLIKIPQVGQGTVKSLAAFKDFDRAEQELEFAEKFNIQVLSFLNKEYPQRMRDVEDCPLIVYYRGTADLNSARMLAVVGARRATDYGRSTCQRLVEELKAYNCVIVSGLAYGIDAVAHRTAVNENIPTLGVLGHGLDMIYPGEHRALAQEMVKSGGGLLTEFPSGTNPDAPNFPKRNRIVAAMCDGVVLVETTRQGGALITAEIANSYSREVFAVPGRINDDRSEGCNLFIKQNKAYLAESADDIAYHLGWEKEQTAQKSRELNLAGLSKDERQVVNLVKERGKIAVDQLLDELSVSATELSIMLLELEFKGILQALPGKAYRVI